MERLHGLRPTLRQMMIVVAFSAILSAAIAPIVGPGWVPGSQALVIGFILVPSPYALAALLRVLDRPGPVRDWEVGLLCRLPLPLLLAYSLGAFVDGRMPMPPNLRTSPAKIILYAIGSGLVGTAWGFVRLLPSRCPGCRRLALIPSKRRGIEKRWCASCGKTFEREVAADR